MIEEDIIKEMMNDTEFTNLRIWQISRAQSTNEYRVVITYNKNKHHVFYVEFLGDIVLVCNQRLELVDPQFFTKAKAIIHEWVFGTRGYEWMKK